MAAKDEADTARWRCASVLGCPKPPVVPTLVFEGGMVVRNDKRYRRSAAPETAGASYTPEATTWVKIKNQRYSQAVGRHDFFDRQRTRG